jgi:hypothetical protein
MKSLKDSFLLIDLSWLMQQVDAERLLDRLGLRFYRRSGDELFSYCPDHHLFVQRKPSHPKWYLNTRTGKTHCFTEGRGSNIVYTVARLRECSAKDAVKWILNIESDDDIKFIKLKGLADKLEQLQHKDDHPDTVVLALNDVKDEIENGTIENRGYEFFMNPPGKKPTGIRKETVQHFKVFERAWGFYKGRVIVPFFQKKELVGFCAIDILGKEEWKRQHLNANEKSYKKVLYPKGLSVGNCLFGYDEIEVGAEELLIVEGARDTMKLWQEGFPNSVGILGSNLTSAQMKLISELCPQRIVLVFDGDVAGYEASEKAAAKLVRFFDVYTVVLPLGIDPKHLNREDIESVIKKSHRFKEKT